MSEEDVQKVNVYLTDMKNFDAMNVVYEQQFSAPYPTRTTVGVTGLCGDALIEIEPADTQTVGTSVNVSGDRTNVVPYIVIIVLLVLALAVVLIKLKRTIKKYETNGII